MARAIGIGIGLSHLTMRGRIGDAHWGAVCLAIDLQDGLPAQETKGLLPITNAGATHDGSKASFDGASWMVLEPPATSLLPAGDFCFEVFGLSMASTTNAHIIGDIFGDGHTSFRVDYRGGNWRIGGSVLSGSIADTPPVNTPFHLCLERVGATLTAYRDGVVIGTATMSGDARAIVKGADAYYIGSRVPGPDSALTGAMQAIRLTRAARYGGAFAEPQPFVAGAAQGWLPAVTYGEMLTYGARNWWSRPSVLVEAERTLLTAVVQENTHSGAHLIAWPLSGVARSVRHDATSANDHNFGALIKVGGTYFWLRTGHNGSEGVALFYGSDLGDLTEKDITAELGQTDHTYTSLFHDGTRFYLFGRAQAAGDAAIWVATSADGINWGAYQQLVQEASGDTPYAMLEQDQAGIHLAYTEAITGTLRYARFTNGALFDSEGVSLGSLPVALSQLETCGVAAVGRVQDLKLIDGRPVIAFAAGAGPTGFDLVRAARVAGGWTVDTVQSDIGDSMSASNAAVPAGAAIDPETADLIIAARKVGGIYQLHAFARSGGVWTASQLTSGAGNKFRPRFDAGAGRKVLTYLGETTTGDWVGLDDWDGVWLAARSESLTGTTVGATGTAEPGTLPTTVTPPTTLSIAWATWDNPNTEENKIIADLEAAGHTVTPFAINNVTMDAESFDVTFICERISSASIANVSNHATTTKGMVWSESFNTDDMVGAGTGGSESTTSYTVQAAHPIATGYSGSVTITGWLYTDVSTTGTEVLRTNAGARSITAWDVGDALEAGHTPTTAPGRRAFVGFAASGAGSANQAAIDLTKQAIEWAGGTL